MTRYNLEGNKIEVVKCGTCGHEVDVTEFWLIKPNGLISPTGVLNPLLICDALCDCCENPNYKHI